MSEPQKPYRVSFGKGEYLIQLLIVVSLVSFAFETLPGLDEKYYSWVHGVEVFTVTVFTVEYLIRIFYCKPRFSYAKSFMGLVDLVAILPFYISVGVDLRSVRAFRLLRLFRLLKLVRYSTAIQRYYNAFQSVREELILFCITALITLYLASVGIYYFEHEAQPEAFGSVFHAFWWAIVTLTTVGYGDVYPITVAGRIFTSVLLFIGLGIVAVPTGLFASALSQAKKQPRE